jgi:hypothetical protein
MLSTANSPDSDIHFWFKEGTQNAWHTDCPHCGEATDLSDHFPACVGYNTGQHTGAPLNEFIYLCPVCQGWIEDTQRGRFIAGNPGASIDSFHLRQITSPTIYARDLVEAWNRAVTGDQKKTFYNRKLGKPYIDKDQLPVTMADCLACVEERKRIGLVWEQYAKDCYMSIDEMGGFNTFIVKRRLPDGRQAVIHVEAIFDIDPFAKCSELMRQYGVTVCVVEQLPNVNDARRFANEFHGRVFLAGYADLRDDMMVWGDDLSTSDRRTTEEDRTRYTVVLQQYKVMQAALYRIRNRHCLFPDPALLEQDVMDRGERKRIAILRDWVFLHLTKTALVVETDEQTRKSRAKVMKVGLDPHFSFANMLCDVAWARNHGTSTIILPEKPAMGAKKRDDVMAEIDKVEKAMPGLPKAIVGMLIDQPRGACARCQSFPRNPDGTVPPRATCEFRGLVVQARDPSCPLYDPVPS